MKYSYLFTITADGATIARVKTKRTAMKRAAEAERNNPEKEIKITRLTFHK